MGLKIIGAGLPRTGTNTLKKSLEILGISKAYHMKELLNNPDKLPLWKQLDDTGTTDWDTLYDGFQASVDFPCYPWYKEHMERYPDAKVIMTVRPFEPWYNSVYNTIWQAGPQTIPAKLGMMAKMAFNPRVRKTIMCIKWFKGVFWHKILNDKFLDKVYVEEYVNRHLEEVKAHVPADKLLVYDVRDGWGPLCEFLGKPMPEQDLPHLNKKENFKTMLKGILKGTEE